MSRQERAQNEVTRWDPSRDLEQSGRDPLERLMRLTGFMDERLARAHTLAPALDIEEDDDGYEISVEIPGVRKDDLDLELQDRTLVIRGEKRSRAESETGREEESEGERSEESAHRSRSSRRRSRWAERSYGRFTRAFSLPSDADTDRLEASYADGVLTITLPRSEASKPRTIDVTGGSA